MPPCFSDLDDTEASLSNGEPNTIGDPPRPLFECVPLRVASQIYHNILGDSKYLQDTGHLPRDQEFLLTENFGIRLQGVKSKEEAAGLATQHHWMPRESHGYEVSSLTMLIEDLSARPRACHYAFTRAENTLRDILYLAPILLTLNCYDLGELVLGEAYREYAKDIKEARNLLEEIEAESFWGDKNVAEVTFAIVMARLLGCDPRTLEPANVFDKIGAISPNILDDILQMRSCNELDPMDCYVELLDVAITARMMELRLDKMDLGLRCRIEHYVPKWDDN